MTDPNRPTCTYSVGDPFNAGTPERECGKPAVKRAIFASEWGEIRYCRRHWSIAAQVIDPSVAILDIVGDDDGA